MLEQLFEKHLKTLSNLKTSFVSSMHNRIIWNERLIGLTGARGVGKTTLVLQHIRDHFGPSPECLYVSLDDISFPYKNLVNLADDFSKNGGKLLVLDEIHKYLNWSTELKNIYDSYPDLGILFTGSSILNIMKGKADLSRRAVIYQMQGLSFREFVQIRTGETLSQYTLEEVLTDHSGICSSITTKLKPIPLFNEYLKYGFYPYFLENYDTYHIKLANTLSITLESDLALIYNIAPQYIVKLKKLTRLLSEGIPFRPNISKLASAIGTSWQSVIHYLQYLHDAEIIKLVYQQGKTIGSLTKPEMVYLNHPNLFFTFRSSINDKGSIRESFFLNQVSHAHLVEKSQMGDFVVDEKYIFEIGGKNKTFHQIAGMENSFIAADDIEFGYKNKIPLWLFGFLY